MVQTRLNGASWLWLPSKPEASEVFYDWLNAPQFLFFVAINEIFLAPLAAATEVAVTIDLQQVRVLFCGRWSSYLCGL